MPECSLVPKSYFVALLNSIPTYLLIFLIILTYKHSIKVLALIIKTTAEKQSAADNIHSTTKISYANIFVQKCKRQHFIDFIVDILCARGTYLLGSIILSSTNY